MNQPTEHYDLIVIGGGPGGYVAAIRAAQLGLKVACIDENAQLGGTCLRVGCIPSKALLESSEKYEEAGHALAEHGVKVASVSLDLAAMLGRKETIVAGLAKGIEALFKKNRITHHQGRGQFVAPLPGGGAIVRVVNNQGSSDLSAPNVIIATGSVPATLPGITLDHQYVGTSTTALCYEQVPKHLVVIGAGFIGLELGSVWRRLGAKVTVLEYLDHILPGIDRQIANEAMRLLIRQGMTFKLGSQVQSVKVDKGQCTVDGQGFEAIVCDRVLMAVGRKPNTDGLGLDKLGIATTAKGFIPVDAYRRVQNSLLGGGGVFAIGDVIGGAMLAHKAEEEGVAVVERIVTGYGHVNDQAIPSVGYIHPEVAGVGRTEEQLQQEKREYRKGVFPFRNLGRARAISQTDGMVKILADAKTDRVLGVHMIGPKVGEMISLGVAAIEYGVTSEDLACICYAHPTLSEAIKEAALSVDQRAIHG